MSLFAMEKEPIRSTRHICQMYVLDTTQCIVNRVKQQNVESRNVTDFKLGDYMILASMLLGSCS